MPEEGCFSTKKPDYDKMPHGMEVSKESGGTVYDPIDGSSELPEGFGLEDFEEDTLEFLMPASDSTTSSGVADPTYDGAYKYNYTVTKPINGAYDPINNRF